MRIITLNANGIRSADEKGLFAWFRRQDADVLCLQEVRARETDLANHILKPRGYHAFFRPAEKPGYSGVAIFSRHAPDRVIREIGWTDIDAEGRFIRADFGPLSVISWYMPSGSSGEVRQTIKFGVMERFGQHLAQLRAEDRHYVITGDFNIAHKNIDLKNWRSNQKNSGFLPEERAFMDRVFGELGWVDAFRAVNQESDQYTWWSNRGQAWAKNVGWRLDYHIVSPGLRDRVKSASVYKKRRFSDHAPLVIDYEWEFGPAAAEVAARPLPQRIVPTAPLPGQVVRTPAAGLATASVDLR